MKRFKVGAWELGSLEWGSGDEDGADGDQVEGFWGELEWICTKARYVQMSQLREQKLD